MSKPVWVSPDGIEKIDSVREQSDPYLGGATRMEGYPATGACSYGGDSNLSYRITNPSFNV
ncbi:hypothetical protein KY284_019414 [Solanum tuberosum]|nr:hypothetical protein KY284_019414 [Solanum tuberosum]